MPESSPAQNHVLSQDSTRLDSREAEDEAEGVITFLPPLVSRILIAGWIVLFAGRWLVLQGMVAAGLLAPELVEKIDELALGRCYFLLVSVTLVTLIVRIVRSRDAQQDPLHSKTDLNAHVGSGAAVEGTVEADPDPTVPSTGEAKRRD